MKKTTKEILGMMVIVILLITAISPIRPAYIYASENDMFVNDNGLTDIEEKLDSEETAATITVPEESDQESTSEAIEKSTNIEQETLEPPAHDDETKDHKEVITYDEQPLTKAEVQAIILAWSSAELGQKNKPHWEFSVDQSLLPEGYNCQLVDYDEVFGANYYTFFEDLIKISGEAVKVADADTLLNTISNAADGMEVGIEIINDFELTETITIPSGKNIKILSTAGNARTLSRKVSGRHFIVRGELTLENITLEGFKALSDQDYGGIFVAQQGILNMQYKSVIQKCRSLYGGAVQVGTGGKFNLLGGSIKENEARDYGGGVCVEDDGMLQMTDGVIVHNICHKTGGGAVYLKGGSFTMNGGIIGGNTVLDGGVGGGLLVAADDAVFTMNNGVVINNSAQNGGGIYVLAGKAYITSGTIEINAAKEHGGGIYGNVDTVLEITGGTICNNMAASGAGIYDIGTIMITAGNINGNDATGEGGGIYAKQITINDSFIKENTAKHGGGMFIRNYTANQMQQEEYTSTINNSVFRGNFAKYKGGAINVLAGTLIVENATEISENIAYDLGAGICVGDVLEPYLSTFANLEMKNSSVINNGSLDPNEITEQGGGIYIMGDPNSTVQSALIMDSKVAGNNAEFGGGMTVYQGNISVSNSIIDGNKATVYGGGIYLFENVIMDFSNAGSITNNSAPNGKGGGIFTEQSTYANRTTDYDHLIISNDIKFSGNTAKRQYEPPANARTLYPKLQFRQTSIKSHPLNDYDINYYSKNSNSGGSSTEENSNSGDNKFSQYILSYDPNGGDGKRTSQALEFGNKHFVLSEKDVGYTYDGYHFAGWNTDPNGEGKAYKSGDRLVITINVTLYAQWTENHGESSINGGTSNGFGTTSTSNTTTPAGIKPDRDKQVMSPSTGVQDPVEWHFLGLGISFTLIISLIWTSKRRNS